ncbi:hypothetical protein CCACVL1_28968 [Corchorus capsularis]|uniref:F-box domain-containing protein n=1 Tax=Corchorus capsularis TaxID=210143 RepID=A0A1R3G4K0_COCAP|nr:hypothetical protein CCACVL1_28968 [Corchorus capsularis]
MESLPQEIVLDIISRLPIQSLLQSKCVCRAWQCLIQDPVLVHKHLCRMEKNDPSIILQSDHPIDSELYLGVLSCQNDGNYNMITKKLPMPPLLRKFYLSGSSNGLICLLDSYQKLKPFIYNPFTGNYLDLPDLPKRHDTRILGFGFAPTTKEYKVVELSFSPWVRFDQVDPPFEADVHVLTIGSPTWRNLGTVPFYFMRRKYNHHVLINGKLHWVSHPTRNRTTNLIISFDLATEKFEEIPLPDCSSSNSNLAKEGFGQVAVLRGCLSALCYEDENEQLEIWVMKEYGVKESWSKEFSTGVFVPKIMLEQEDPGSFFNSKYYLHQRQTGVLCLLRSGELLLEYRNKALGIYDPKCRIFRDVQFIFEGIPKFRAVLDHVTSLNWIDSTSLVNIANG